MNNTESKTPQNGSLIAGLDASKVAGYYASGSKNNLTTIAAFAGPAAGAAGSR
jgi:hypothetical protein